jgi:hypothetical protein
MLRYELVVIYTLFFFLEAFFLGILVAGFLTSF